MQEKKILKNLLQLFPSAEHAFLLQQASD